MTDKPGPTYYDCDDCHTKPAIGILTLPDGQGFLRLCQQCVPNSPIFDFEVYADHDRNRSDN